MTDRTAKKQRKTGETDISLELFLDGASDYENSTGVGFFDHMLDLVARHGRFGLKVNADGDTETGAHHTVEDVGIVLGQALDEALGDRAGIRRYGSALVPMDEALAECAIDISGRPHWAKLTLHINVRYGSNVHHMIEAAFKAFARALRVAVSIDPEETGVPSTKGTLHE
jgi:imidazoleglycerol-phosphate dehydratase